MDGCLHNQPKPKTQRDLITEETYDEFELKWDWKIKANVNSGVKYFVEEKKGGAIGHEYQMLDDDSPEWKAKGTVHATGSFYDVLVPTGCPTKPVGEFNHSRILVRFRPACGTLAQRSEGAVNMNWVARRSRKQLAKYR